MADDRSDVLVVGAGPAGAALAYLLARRGLRVALLERQVDSAREFRGEALQPSGVDAVTQMGLGAELAALPQSRVRASEIWRNGRLVARTELTPEAFGVEGPHLVPQPAFLDMLTAAASKHPTFALRRELVVRDVIRADGRVVGVRATSPHGSEELRAAIVVGADGRFSAVRKAAGLERAPFEGAYDVLWVRTPLPEGLDRETFRIESAGAHVWVSYVSHDGRLQLAVVLPKGELSSLRSAGGDLLDVMARRVSPPLAAHLLRHRDAASRPAVLDAISGRLPRWTEPGLLLIGDAAHPMSPVGGQGINIALRDAIVAANHLCPALLGPRTERALDDAAAAVQAEREREVVAIQAVQARQQLVYAPSTPRAQAVFWLMPWIARLGLTRRVFGPPFRLTAYGTERVTLTA